MKWWIEEIANKLKDGKNCVLQTLAYNHGETVAETMIELGVLQRNEIIFHHSKQSDKLKKQLRDVNSLWIKARLLIYTNSVESVSCSRAFL